MKHARPIHAQVLALFVVLCLSLMPVAFQLQAQTPESPPLPPSEETVEVPPAPEPPAPEPPAPPAPEPPAENPPAENPPAEAPPAGNPPAENPPAENPPAENPPAENPPAENHPAENPPAEEPPAENPPAENPPAEDPETGESGNDEVIEDTNTPDTENQEESTSESSADDGENESTETSTTEAIEEVEEENASTPKPESEVENANRGTPEPTATEEVIVPDELNLVGEATISIAPGEYKDVVVSYTLGSDREKTEVSANLTAPGGETLDGWTLVPLQRVDLDEDPADANRHLNARFDQVENLENGDVFETTWRITAPDHIEKPVTVRLHTSSKIHREDGVTDGVIKNDFVTINATASVHTPTFTCDAVVAEDVENTWNCAFDTTHPDDDVAITASADVPEGWELSLDGVELTAEPLALSAEAIAADSFTLTAEYPIGCPDINTTISSVVGLAMTYPTGEIADLDAELPLVFERPEPKFEITSFEFDEMDLTQTLSTTGRMTVSYNDLPCAWQATLQLTDLESDMYTIPSDLIQIESVDGLPDASISIVDGSISISADAASEKDTSGEFAIHFDIDLPHQIPPGAYRIGVTTQFNWADQD